jgi:hypothetical protein
MKAPIDTPDPHLQAALNRLHPTPERDPQAAALGRSRFLILAESYAASATPAVMAGRPSIFDRLWQSSARPASLGMRLALFILIVAVLFGSGTTAAVLAARDALPGETLYPVKTLEETIRLSAAFDSRQQLTLELRFAARRIDELERLNDQNPALAETIVNDYTHKIDNALKAAASMDAAGMAQSLTIVNQTLATQDQTLRQTAARTTQPAPALERALRFNQTRLNWAVVGVTSPTLFRRQFGGPAVTPPAGAPPETPTPSSTPVPSRTPTETPVPASTQPPITRPPRPETTPPAVIVLPPGWTPPPWLTLPPNWTPPPTWTPRPTRPPGLALTATAFSIRKTEIRLTPLPTRATPPPRTRPPTKLPTWLPVKPTPTLWKPPPPTRTPLPSLP